ncbi:hypothetical protein [Williamsia deligens]|uniref:Uncharacterized protein n=1 Tax=Williamsia deligens TaxID=321325 RepID=A0ABW3G9K5_9NOCA|nr:hypothetical protein [Williamsia deligens]MCP2192357.1 hypothetical protein [Williamsia deligens]
MTSVEVDPGAQDPDVHDTVAMLRARLATVSAERSVSVTPADQQSVTVVASQQRQREVLPVPEALAGVMPGGGVARGAVTAVDGARSLLVAIIASVTAAGGYVAVVGHPHLSLHAAAEMGADLSRIATVPGPSGPDRTTSSAFDPVEVAAVLLDGLDLVVVGLGGISVPPSRSRAVMARARAKGSALIVTDGRWAGARASVTARVEDYRHTPFRHIGHGRIAGLSLTVHASDRGAPGTDTRVDVVHLDGRVQVVAAQPVESVASSGRSASARSSLSVAN